MIQAKHTLAVLLGLLLGLPAWGATTVRSSTIGNNSTGTALSCTKPTGTASGDVAFAIAVANGATTIVDNNGGTSFTEDLNDEQETGSGITLSVFSRRINGSEGSSFAFTSGASGRWSVICVTFQNPHASVIYDVTPAVGIKNSTSGPACPTITTANANSLHVCISASDGDSNTLVSGPATYTVEKSGGNEAQVFTYKLIAAAGATGAQTMTWTNIDIMIPVSFAVRDNPGAGGSLKVNPLSGRGGAAASPIVTGQ